MGTTLSKNTPGFGYKYTEMADINIYLESKGITYYQYTETIDGVDYIYTVPIVDGKEQAPRRGCRIITATMSGKSNPAQEQGSGITYARRYSLLMAFGLATTDDDAACMTEKKVEKVKGEVIPKEEPKEKNMIPGYPKKEDMIAVAKKHYPDGSDNLKKLLETFKAESIDALKEEQLAAIYEKFGGR